MSSASSDIYGCPFPNLAFRPHSCSAVSQERVCSVISNQSSWTFCSASWSISGRLNLTLKQRKPTTKQQIQMSCLANRYRYWNINSPHKDWYVSLYKNLVVHQDNNSDLYNNARIFHVAYTNQYRSYDTNVRQKKCEYPTSIEPMTFHAVGCFNHWATERPWLTMNS